MRNWLVFVTLTVISFVNSQNLDHKFIPLHFPSESEIIESVSDTAENIQARFGESESKKLFKKNQCGVQVTSDRIIGGNATAIDEFPFLALLYYKNPKNNKTRYACGGTLIKSKTIITAAHCVEGDLGKRFEFVRLGEWNTKTEKDCVPIGLDEEECSDDPIDFRSQRIFIHPSRNPAQKANDIALIILDREPPYTDFIRPICLPTKAFETPKGSSQILVVAGWGSTTQYIRTPSEIKMKLKLKHVSHGDCQAKFEPYNTIISNETQVCAGGERGKGTCGGDSGGPLMFFEAGKLHIVGIVSFGTEPCAEAEIPGVFVNVWPYMEWINQNAV
uniref:CSON006215 protein n=1 Tax=Culicoides sonorensis TaxID=179676 RepID=A0A336MS33_CULSO